MSIFDVFCNFRAEILAQMVCQIFKNWLVEGNYIEVMTEYNILVWLLRIQIGLLDVIQPSIVQL